MVNGMPIPSSKSDSGEGKNRNKYLALLSLQLATLGTSYKMTEDETKKKITDEILYFWFYSSGKVSVMILTSLCMYLGICLGSVFTVCCVLPDFMTTWHPLSLTSVLGVAPRFFFDGTKNCWTGLDKQLKQFSTWFLLQAHIWAH